MENILLLMIVALFVMLVAILGMTVFLFLGRKPIQHCGSSSIFYKGKRIDCPVCQGSPEDCETEVASA